MARGNPKEDVDNMFPRLAQVAGNRDLSMDALTPRLSRLLKEEEVDAEDLQIRGQTDTEQQLKAMLDELEAEAEADADRGGER